MLYVKVAFCASLTFILSACQFSLLFKNAKAACTLCTSSMEI